MTRFLIVPQWQGSPAARAMLLTDGAAAIAGDLPRRDTTVLDVPLEAGDALGTGIRRLSALLRTRELIAEHLRLSGRGRRKNFSDAEIAAARDDEAAELLAFLLLYARHNGIDLDAGLDRKWFSYLRADEENG